MNKDHYKKISFLATGTEIVTGDIHERNMHDFSLEISEKGGILFQHIACTDENDDIVCALQYLLTHSDVVIVTGGLGPTSDDRTRYALAEVLQVPLILKEAAWVHVQERLAQFNLRPNPGQQQQALFPENCTLLPNLNGSAYGCYVESHGKLIFLLPGPPRENKPLFTQFVLPKLQEWNCFTARQTYRWLTLGLAEGTIAPQIDAIAEKYEQVATSFRWNYPYLEIKIVCDGNPHIQRLLAEIETKLAPNIVSTDKQLAHEILQNKLRNFSKTIYVVDQVSGQELALRTSQFPNIVYVNSNDDVKELRFLITSTLGNITTETAFEGNVTFSVQGFADANRLYEASVTVPYRAKEVTDYAMAYSAWQLGRFVDLIMSQS